MIEHFLEREGLTFKKLPKQASKDDRQKKIAYNIVVNMTNRCDLKTLKRLVSLGYKLGYPRDAKGGPQEKIAVLRYIYRHRHKKIEDSVKSRLLDNAVDSGEIEVVRFLVEEFAAATAITFRHLATALKGLDIEIADYLYSVSPEMDYGPLYEENIPGLVGWLVKKGVKTTSSSFGLYDYMSVSIENNYSLIRSLLRHQVPIHDRLIVGLLHSDCFSLREWSSNHHNPLIEAVLKQRSYHLGEYLEAYAICCGDIRTLEWLLEKGYIELRD